MITKEDCQQRIAALLADLESSTGTIVKGIEVVDIDVTTFDSRCRQLARRVEIDLEHIPGTSWDTGSKP